MIARPGTYFKIKDIRDTRGTKNVREEEPDIGSMDQSNYPMLIMTTKHRGKVRGGNLTINSPSF